MAGGSGLTTVSTRQAQRRKRQAWTFVTLVSLVLLVGLVAVGQWLRWWELGGPTQRVAAIPCPEQTTTTPRTVTANVLNGTQTFGLGRKVAAELQARGFRVASITNDETGAAGTGIALIRHGPPGLRSATTLARQFPAGVKLEDDGRDSRTVDLIVGPGFRSFTPAPEASKAIAAVPTPTGCVPATTPPATTPPAPPPTT